VTNKRKQIRKSSAEQGGRHLAIPRGQFTRLPRRDPFPYEFVSIFAMKVVNRLECSISFDPNRSAVKARRFCPGLLCDVSHLPDRSPPIRPVIAAFKEGSVGGDT
jgi:hypothetical protein